MKRVGVLAMQGAFAEHIATLKDLGVEAQPIRLPQQLASLDALVIPGGESTTIGHLLNLYGLTQGIREMAAQGLPILATCAGLILLARKAPDLEEDTIDT